MRAVFCWKSTQTQSWFVALNFDIKTMLQVKLARRDWDARRFTAPSSNLEYDRDEFVSNTKGMQCFLYCNGVPGKVGPQIDFIGREAHM
jgi:hypothetical protein